MPQRMPQTSAAKAREEKLKTRKKLLEDFEFYAKHCVKIRTKKGTIVHLIFNRVQRRFAKLIIDQMLTRGYVRMVVLKARQQGLSTVITAWQYWWVSQRKAQKGLVMAHEADSTATLWDMYKRVHDNVPETVKPHNKYNSKNELTFDVLDSALRIATAGGRGVARGDTLQVAHLSEVAFWPPGFAKANFNGLIQAVPDEPGTAVFIESTAQGMTGKFREAWLGATNGSTGYMPFFSAWFESDEYRVKPNEVPADFVRTPDEEKLIERFYSEGLTCNEQLVWRRRKIANSNDDLFMQEYPATPDEAFISTGRPVFEPKLIQEQLAALHVKPTIIKTMAVENITDNIGSLVDNSRGELSVYRKRDPKETYVIGADVGMGVRGGDPSVAQILDSQMNLVATWRGVAHPDYFAKVLATLGYHYHTALIAPERNNHGLVTCITLRDLLYPNLYTDVVEGTMDDGKDTIRLGFFTSEATKPLIIDKLRSSFKSGEVVIEDTTTLNEMLTFVVTESGRLQAEEGAHDDTVIALALALYVHEGKWVPVPFSDSCYSKAI
jgi:hypothetical protein